MSRHALARRRGERRRRGAALLLVLVLLGLLLFLVRSHLTFRHGVLPLSLIVASRSAALHHALIAELLHHARFEAGGDGLRHSTHMPALMTGHRFVRRQQRRTRKAVVGAMRALPDRAEQEVICHLFSLRRPTIGRVAACR